MEIAFETARRDSMIMSEVGKKESETDTTTIDAAAESHLTQKCTPPFCVEHLERRCSHAAFAVDGSR